MPSSQIYNQCVFKLFMFTNQPFVMWTPCIYYLPFDNYRFLPRRPSYCWPDLVSRIRFSQLPLIQTDSVRLCCILCIYHLTIRFPPGGLTRLLLARSVFTCYCNEQPWPCERRRHNQTKLGNVTDVTTGPAPRSSWSAPTQCDHQLMELL